MVNPNLRFAHIQNGGKWLSNCHENLVYGMYDLGTAPSVSLMASGNQILLLEVHRGAPKGTIVPDCGNVIPIDDLVLDGWLFSLF